MKFACSRCVYMVFSQYSSSLQLSTFMSIEADWRFYITSVSARVKGLCVCVCALWYTGDLPRIYSLPFSLCALETPAIPKRVNDRWMIQTGVFAASHAFFSLVAPLTTLKLVSVHNEIKCVAEIKLKCIFVYRFCIWFIKLSNMFSAFWRSWLHKLKVMQPCGLRVIVSRGVKPSLACLWVRQEKCAKILCEIWREWNLPPYVFLPPQHHYDPPPAESRASFGQTESVCLILGTPGDALRFPLCPPERRPGSTYEHGATEGTRWWGPGLREGFEKC